MEYFVEQDYGSDQETVEFNKATLLKDLEASINRKIKRDQIMMPATFNMTLKSGSLKNLGEQNANGVFGGEISCNEVAKKDD